jgi:hypothetical protein
MTKLTKALTFLFVVGIIGLIVYLALPPGGKSSSSPAAAGTTVATTTAAAGTTTPAGNNTPVNPVPGDTTDTSAKGLGAGAKAGISVIGLILILAIGIYIYRRGRRARSSKVEEEEENNGLIGGIEDAFAPLIPSAPSIPKITTAAKTTNNQVVNKSKEKYEFVKAYQSSLEGQEKADVQKIFDKMMSTDDAISREGRDEFNLIYKKIKSMPAKEMTPEKIVE